LANVLLHAVALTVWAWFLFTTVGRRGAVAGVWLLATWPGLSYWAGLPYVYAAIVPFSVLAFPALHFLTEPRSLRATFLNGLFLGTLTQGYDALMMFGVAGLALVAWRQRRGLPLVVLAVGLILPGGLTALALVHVFQVPTLVSSNSSIYGVIASAYWEGLQGKVDLAAWAGLARGTASVLVSNFLDSGFAVLPALFVVLLILSLARAGRRAFHPAEAVLLLVFLALFLFNNLAPPYQGWQMRGEWIARLYQPVFVAYLYFIARQVHAFRGCGGGCGGSGSFSSLPPQALIWPCRQVAWSPTGKRQGWSITASIAMPPRMPTSDTWRPMAAGRWGSVPGMAPGHQCSGGWTDTNGTRP
ncbi:MAG: hypothetical protein ABT940_11790, partial [Alphaproteobacteria bacterium]